MSKQFLRQLTQAATILKHCSTPQTTWNASRRLHIKQASFTETADILTDLKLLSRSIGRGKTFYSCTVKGKEFALSLEALHDAFIKAEAEAEVLA